MFGKIIGFAKGLIPGVGGGSLWWLYVAAALVIAAGSAWITHRADLATVEDIKLGYAKAEAKAVQDAKDIQAATDKVALDAAVAEAQAQQKIVVRTVTTVKEVPRYVSDRSDCITFGLVRVLDAGALGVDPADLELPAGKSNDACAPIASSDLARSVGANYGAALQNAKQLDDLEDTVRKMVAASQGSRDPSLLAGHRQ